MKLSKTLEFLSLLPYFGILVTVVANGVPVYVLSPTPSDISDDVLATAEILGLKDPQIAHCRPCLLSKPLKFKDLVRFCKSFSKIF